MDFNPHSNLIGKHAFLSASKYHWINYDEDKLITSFENYRAAQIGTRYHDLARELIELGEKLPKRKRTLNLYVNDAIGFRMTPEQPLYYSENCFGTADAIAFRNNFLRIHDLKTGVSPASMSQLEIYAAIFCLEYDFRPHDIRIELRIYQSDQIIVHEPDPDDILAIMEKIVFFDKCLQRLKLEA